MADLPDAAVLREVRPEQAAVSAGHVSAAIDVLRWRMVEECGLLDPRIALHHAAGLHDAGWPRHRPASGHDGLAARPHHARHLLAVAHGAEPDEWVPCSHRCSCTRRRTRPAAPMLSPSASLISPRRSVAPKYGSPRSVRVRTTFDSGTAGTLDKPGTTGRVVRGSLACDCMKERTSKDGCTVQRRSSDMRPESRAKLCSYQDVTAAPIPAC